jgi:hypothetical protein
MLEVKRGLNFVHCICRLFNADAICRRNMDEIFAASQICVSVQRSEPFSQFSDALGNFLRRASQKRMLDAQTISGQTIHATWYCVGVRHERVCCHPWGALENLLGKQHISMSQDQK